MKRYWKTILLLWLLPAFATAQTNDFCATEVTPENLKAVQELREGLQRYDIGKMRSLSHEVPIQVHIIRQSDGQGGTDEHTIFKAIDLVNDMYAEAEIEFYVSKKINYIDSDRFYDFAKMDEELIAQANDIPGALNIYFANTVSANDNAICGYTHMPGSDKDRIFMAKGCVDNGSTLAHEIGHYLSLMHTHGFSSGSGELVNGSNCSEAGDLICDTPADPKLTGVVNTDCEYTGNAKDLNGDPFNPDVSNLMSYAPSYCRATFTQEQINQMLFSLQQNHTNLQRNDDFITVADVLQEIAQTADATLEVNVYPNPSQGFANISLQNMGAIQGYVNVSVVNLNGQVVYEYATDNPMEAPLPVDLSMQQKGIYLVNVIANNTMTTQRLMVQ